MEVSLAVKIHLYTISPAIFIGLYLLLGKKGTRLHIGLGFLWCFLMIVSAISTFFITGYDTFHFLHFLAFFSVVGIVIGWIGIYKKRKRMHFVGMLSSYAGSVIAGYFAVMTPGRYTYQLIFG